MNTSMENEELKKELALVLDKNFMQSIACKSHWGTVRYFGSRTIGTIDPGAYIMYLLFHFFCNN